MRLNERTTAYGGKVIKNDLNRLFIEDDGDDFDGEGEDSNEDDGEDDGSDDDDDGSDLR